MNSAANGAPSAASLRGEAGECSRARLEDVALVAAAGIPAGSRDVGVRRAVDEGQRAGRIEADATRAPGAAAEHPLRDRKRVEELVGDDDRPGQRRARARRSSAAERRRRSSVARWIGTSAALLSISSTRSAARNAGTRRTARNASRISVPRPGPSSMSRTGSGLPICCQTTAHHSPTSSPNTWLISGAVTKSPPLPMAACRR